MQQNLFYFVTLSLFALMHWIAYALFLKKLCPKLSGIFKVLLLVNFLGIVAYFAGRYWTDLPTPLYYWMSLSIGLIFVLFVSTLLYRLLLLVTLFSRSRRLGLQKGVGLFSGILACGYVGWGLIEGNLDAKIETVSIKLKGLKKNFSAVQISDLHIGGLIGKEETQNIVAKIMSLNPDVIFLTGDIIDTKVSLIQEALGELGKLRAPLGVYCVLGNHEFFHGIYDVVTEMKLLGFCVLQNQNVVLQKDGEAIVNLVGVNDLFGRRFGAFEPDLMLALDSRQDDLPSILLAHQPKFSKEVKEDHRIDLILSGHTHGGQIFPFGFLTRLDQPYLAGLYRHTENTKIYINRGSGFWGPPMRVGAQAEITHFKFDL